MTDNEVRERVEAIVDRCGSCALNVNGLCHSTSCHLNPGDHWWPRNYHSIAHRAYLQFDWTARIVATQTPCHAYTRRTACELH